MRTRNICLLVYENAQPLDVSGPLQALEAADEESGRQAYDITIATLGPLDLRLSGGLRVRADPLPKKRLDTFILPGGPGVHAVRRGRDFHQVAEHIEHAERVCSICTGAYLLAQAGVLNGRRATTHWKHGEALQREFPRIQVQRDQLWVRDGKYWSSAGVTSGIDLALALIEEDLGRSIAQRVARRLVVYMRRSGGQAQYSTPLALQSDNVFGSLVDWLMDNLEKDIHVEDMAAHHGASVRGFHRHFVSRMGATPAKALETLRLERCCQLLSSTSLPLLTVARKCGFSSEETLRRAFRRQFGIGPVQWRAQFSETGVEHAAS